MKLKTLLRDLPELEVRGSKEIQIRGLTSHSKEVAPGDLFIAKKGLAVDGSLFIPQAAASGAAAILTPVFDPFLKQTQIVCKAPEKIEPKLAARYYGHPSQDLWIAGVTGTKGKTTSAYLIQHLLNGLGQPCGLMGTIETVVGERRFPSRLTTHDAIYNQKMLREMAVNGCTAVSMEVSSHGLAQGRVEEIDFDVAVFTNLYPDHLDYHRTMEEYAAAKKKLLTQTRFGIFNADSPWAREMRQGRMGLTFGIENRADVQGSEIECKGQETSFTVEYQGAAQRFTATLIGLFNVSNLLGAVAVGLHLGASLSRIASVFSRQVTIPGRMELVLNALGLRVYVDFSHTGEALESALLALRAGIKGRLTVVFGCGGNRDPGRRAGMAKAADAFADLSIVTTDNPRTEDPEAICREILCAFQSLSRVVVEPDRKLAIERAVQGAEEGDVILIAGKGHEKTQAFAHRTVPFDDCLIAKEALQKRRNSAILSFS